MAEQVIIVDASEIWTPIRGYESFYCISNFGRVKALAKKVSTGFGRLQDYAEKIMSTSVASNGYLMVGLQVARVKKTFTVHRLVATHFVSNPNNYKIINHKDGNKLNCHSDNLEWTTYSQNALHAYGMGLRVGAWIGKTGRNHHRTKSVIQLDLQGEEIMEWESAGIAATKLCVDAKAIRSVCGKENKTYKGFKWAYKN